MTGTKLLICRDTQVYVSQSGRFGCEIDEVEYWEDTLAKLEAIIKKPRRKKIARRAALATLQYPNKTLIPVVITSIGDEHGRRGQDVRVTDADKQSHRVGKQRVYADTPSNRIAKSRLDEIAVAERTLKIESARLIAGLTAFDFEKGD